MEIKMKDAMINVIVHLNATHSLDFMEVPNGKDIKERLTLLEKIPSDLLSLRINGSILGDEEFLTIGGAVCGIVVRATIKNAIKGGKGGFGAMLRALAKQSGTKKTTDFGACRDLSGRRLRHVNDEKILQKWKEAKDAGEEFDPEEETPSGIEMWYVLMCTSAHVCNTSLVCFIIYMQLNKYIICICIHV
jgi:hypothetical protein